MSKDGIDRFAVESQLLTLNGLAQALSILSHSPNLDDMQREAIGGMADAFEDQFKALWRLTPGGEFPRGNKASD